MDWQKTIDSVGEVARKTFTLALALVLIMASLTGVYVIAIALLWVVKKAREALGA